jgi:hypothetical protein
LSSTLDKQTWSVIGKKSQQESLAFEVLKTNETKAEFPEKLLAESL